MARFIAVAALANLKNSVESCWRYLGLKPYLRKLDSWNRVQLEKVLNGNGWPELAADTEYLSIIARVASAERAVALFSKLQPQTMIRSIIGKTVTAEVQVRCLTKLLRNKEILYLKICERRHISLLGSSVAQYPNQPLVGIIDTGIDLQPEQFVDSKGRLRVIALWDQRKPGMNGPLLAGPTPGRIYYGADIKNYFNAKQRQGSYGHGEAAAMIAAGNKPIRMAGHCTINMTGAEFPIVLIETTKDEGDILDALSFLQQQSQLLGLPCVVNLSFGKHNGPHDGRSLLSTALETISDSRLIVVAAVGNDGTKAIHLRKTFDGHQGCVEFAIQKNAPGQKNIAAALVIHGWVNLPEQLRLSVSDPYGNVYGPVEPETWKEWDLTAAKLTVINNISKGSNTKNEIQLVIQFEQDCVEGIWRLNCNSKTNRPKTAEFWVVSQMGCDCSFMGGGQQSTSFTVSDLAVSKEVLAVGGYGFDHQNRQYRVVPESSYHQAEQAVKPDLLAPWSFEVPNRDNLWVKVEGSSYAAPLITRLVARLWQQHFDWDTMAIKMLLKGKMLLFDAPDLELFQKEAALESFTPVSWNETGASFDKSACGPDQTMVEG